MQICNIIRDLLTLSFRLLARLTESSQSVWEEHTLSGTKPQTVKHDVNISPDDLQTKLRTCLFETRKYQASIQQNQFVLYTMMLKCNREMKTVIVQCKILALNLTQVEIISVWPLTSYLFGALDYTSVRPLICDAMWKSICCYLFVNVSGLVHCQCRLLQCSLLFTNSEGDPRNPSCMHIFCLCWKDYFLVLLWCE